MTKLTWAEHTDRVAMGEIGYPVVEIVWEDASSFGAPDWVEEINTNLGIVTTVGYLVAEDERTFTVVSLINRCHVGHGITIAKSSVLRHAALGDLSRLQ